MLQVNRGDGWENLNLEVKSREEPLWAEKRDKIIDMYDYRAVKQE